MKLDKTVLGVIERLGESGFEAWVAGGAARDTLSGVVPEDIDVVTDALPHQIEAVFRKERVRTVGVSFRVCLVNGVEVATYRARRGVGARGGGAPIYARTLSEDLACRDLTMNSLALSPVTGEMVDLFGGARDLKEGIIRFTGSAEDRIREDPCRVIRACRFLAKYEGRFAGETLEGLRRHGPGVGRTVSPERIRMEVVKALSCRKPSIFFGALREIGALSGIFPALDGCFGVDGGPYHAETVWEHSLLAVDAAPEKNVRLRLAALLHDTGKPAAAREKKGRLTFVGHELSGYEETLSQMRRLKFSNEDIAYVAGLVKLHMRTLEPETTPRAVRRLLKAMGDEGVAYRDWVRLRIADRKANLGRENYTFGEIRAVMERIHEELYPREGKRVLSVGDLAIGGADVMALLSLPQGPEVGRILRALLDLVLEDPSLNRREVLERLAAEV